MENDLNKTTDLTAMHEYVAGPGTDVEVRHATVLKCDLVSSTRTKRALDLDGQLAFQLGFEEIVNGLANRHGAHVAQYEGDGAMVMFGYPQQVEDAVESAVRMGLELVSAISESRLVPNMRLEIRVGIASGQTAVIKRGSSGGTFAGLTMDLAERLRAIAKPGQVIIADAAKRLAGGFFSYEDLGIVCLKGFDEGVRAWRITGESLIPSRFEAQRFDESRTAIIGRKEPLDLLAQTWASVRDGNGKAVCLLGEAGIGKSRLARAALDAAICDGATTLEIDCMPSTGNTTLFPVGVLLRRAANITPTSSQEEKKTLAQELIARLLPPADVPAALTFLAPLFGLQGVPIEADISATDVRERTISTVVQMLKRAAAEQPVVVVCEDLHWVDDTTAEVISRVCNEIGEWRALAIVTMRPTSDQPPIDLSTFRTIALDPLEPATAAELVRSIAKGTVLSDQAVAQIVDQCEGVPLVLEEVTRSALEAVNRSDDPIATGGPDEEVPAPLQLVVQSRLSRWPGLVSIVQSASVLGREFSIPLLQGMTGRERLSEVADAVQLLSREGLFEDQEPRRRDHARFKHAMICQAVYNTLLGRDRQYLHSRAADILAGDYKGTADAAPDVIAEHLRKARRYPESIRVRLVASADMTARGAYVEAKGHCQAALALVDDIAEAEERRTLQFRLLIQLGVALTGEHGYSAAEVEDVYRRAHAVCGYSAEAEMLYPIMRGQATVNLVRGNLAIAYNLSVEGLQLAEQSKRVEFVIDAMSVLCYTTLYYRRLEECRSWIERCLQLYHAEQGDSLTYPVPQNAGTAAIALLPTVTWLLGDSQGAEDAVREGLEHVDRLNRDFDKALLHAWIAGTRYTQRRYPEALQHAGTAVEISLRHGYREWYATGALVALMAQAALSPNPDAVAQALDACAAFDREGVGLNASYYCWGLARGYATVGDVESARQMLAVGFARAEASRETRINPELLMLQAELEPDNKIALQLLDSALALADEQGAIATALRAAARMMLLGRDDEKAALARATLDLLDGRSALPEQRDWMQASLSKLRATDAAATP